MCSKKRSDANKGKKKKKKYDFNPKHLYNVLI